MTSGSDRRGARARAALRAVLLTGASVAFALLLAEVTLRILGWYAPADGHRLPPHSSQRDIQTHWDLTYHTNSLGMRDREHLHARPSGVDLRLVVVGDSFTFGQGVEDASSFPSLLERALARRGIAPEVINVSNIGIAPESYFVLLRDVGLTFSPDVVVVNVFGNDASYDTGGSWTRSCAVALSEQTHVGTLLRAVWSRFRTRETRGLLDDPAAFWRRLASVCALHRPAAECETMTHGFQARFGSRINNLAAACLTDPEEVRREVYTEPTRGSWRDLSRYVRRMRELCDASGVRMVLAVVPDGVQVDPDQLQVRRSLGVSYPDDVLTAPGPFQSDVAKLASRLRLDVYDPLPAFRARPTGLYFPGDFHWTPEGNRLYAEGLATFLEERGYLRRPAVP